MGSCSFNKPPLQDHLSFVSKDILTFGAVPWIYYCIVLSLLNFLLALHAQEENSVFVMTNMIFTLNQTQGQCPEVGTGSALILRGVGRDGFGVLFNCCSCPASR